MEKRGPKKKPHQLKIIQGTARKDRTNTSAPNPNLLNKIPPCPARFNARAKVIWKTVCTNLNDLNLLTDVDVHMVEEYVYWKEMSERAEKELKENGEVCEFVNKANQTYITESPWLAIKQKASDRVLKIGVQFGFTPSSRSDIKAPPKETLDPLQAILQKKKA